MRKSGYRLRLAGQPLRVLEMLLERPGDVVSREELQRRLWPADTFVDFDHNLNSAVKRLRAALGDSAGAPRFIETLPRRGYRFVAAVDVIPAAPVAAAGDEAEAAIAPPATAPGAAAPAPVTRPWRWIAAAAIAVTAIATVAMIARVPPSAPARRVTSVAVLPLTYQGLGSTAHDVFLADGMTEALIAELSTLRGLRVISETSSGRYRGPTLPPLPAIARELGVDGIIEGSVSREGDVVRVSVQLIHAATDSHLWAQTYTRGLGSALALHSEVARDIASEIGTQAATPDRRRVPSGRDINLEAYRAYVLGHRLWQRETEPELYAAIDHFQRALQLEPGYARASWGIAEAWIALGSWSAYVPPLESLPKAKAAALKALELDPALAEAHSALAFVTEVHDWDLPGAEASYRRALELNPNDANTHRRFGLFLNRTKRAAAGVEHARRAFELDPLSVENNISVGQRLFSSGERDNGVAAMLRATELDPTHFHPWVHLAELYKHMGRQADALAAAERGVQLSRGGGHAAHMLASIHWRFGDGDAAAAVMRPFEQPGARINPFDLGMFFLDLGDREKALQWLATACEQRAPQMAFFHLTHATTAFDPIRPDARFAKIVTCATTGLKPLSRP